MQDAELRQDVIHALEFEPSIDAAHIGVTAERGVVTKLSGVIGVINQIVIKPAVTAPDVKGKIEAALMRHAQVEAKAIRVSVFDGTKVLLDGVVDSLDAREAAEKAAWSVAGVQSVDDQLTVMPY